MAFRQPQQPQYFEQGPPVPPHGSRYAPGIQGPRPMPQPRRGPVAPAFYEGPITPGSQVFDGQPSTPGAPRRGPAPRGPAFGRHGSGLSVVPGGKRQGNKKPKKVNGVSSGAIASPVAVLKEFGNALDAAPKAPKSFSFHTSTHLNRKGAQHQTVDINAKWGSRSGSISSEDSMTDSLVDAAFLEGAITGGAAVGTLLGEMVGDFPDSRRSSRKSSNASSSSGSLFELPGGVSVGRRDSMGSTSTGSTAFIPGHSTSGSPRPCMPFKHQSSSINDLSKPRAGVRESNLERIAELNNRNHSKKLNMGKNARNAIKANSSRSRQP